MNFAEQYSYNEDGSVRGEFVTKEHGVIPLSYSAKMFGVDLTKKVRCRKSEFRGMLFGVKYINNDGLACDANGNPLEDPTTYVTASEITPEKWDQHIFISRDGSSALDDAEWENLSAEEKASYRKVDCIEVDVSAGIPINGPVYLCREAVVFMAELLKLDVRINDPINKRYQYECQHNTAFAAQFGYVLNEALEELERDLAAARMAHGIAREIMEMFFGFGDDDDKPDKEDGESCQTDKNNGESYHPDGRQPEEEG